MADLFDDEMKRAFGLGGSDHTGPVRVIYEFDNGFTVTGTADRATVRHLFRDPEDINRVLHLLKAGEDVVCVLPSAKLIRFQIG